MARLILEEAGERRAFRVKEGRLTIGSGEGATLRLTSTGVADVHAELAFEGGRVTLEPRPGVLPPELDGAPVVAASEIPHGATFTIGDATFRLEYEDAASAPKAKAAPAVQRAAPQRSPQRSTSRTPAKATAKARSGQAAAAEGTERPRVQHSRRRVERGVPTWLVLVIIGVVAIFAVFAVRGMLEDMGEGTLDPTAAYNEALNHYNEGLYVYAAEHLDRIEAQNADLSEGLTRQIRGLRERLKAKDQEADLFTHNQKGTVWLSTQLKRFVNDRLQGDPKPERVRIFLMRCQEFRQRWPQHPEMDWVTRYEARFKPSYDFSKPPTFDDVAFEVKTLTWAMPRNYVKGFELLASFRESASVEDRVKVDNLVETLKGEQQEYFVDRMQQAKYHWDKEEKDLSVGWLIELVIGLDEPDLVAQAAQELANLPGVDPQFPAYKEHEPEKWAQLMENPTIAAMSR